MVAGEISNSVAIRWWFVYGNTAQVIFSKCYFSWCVVSDVYCISNLHSFILLFSGDATSVRRLGLCAGGFKIQQLNLLLQNSQNSYNNPLLLMAGTNDILKVVRLCD